METFSTHPTTRLPLLSPGALDSIEIITMRDKRKNVMRRLSEFEETVSITLMPSLLYTDHAALIRAGSSQNIYNIITHDDFFRKTKRSLSDPEAGPTVPSKSFFPRGRFGG
jgi:hypothetical protein